MPTVTVVGAAQTRTMMGSPVVTIGGSTLTGNAIMQLRGKMPAPQVSAGPPPAVVTVIGAGQTKIRAGFPSISGGADVPIAGNSRAYLKTRMGLPAVSSSGGPVTVHPAVSSVREMMIAPQVSGGAILAPPMRIRTRFGDPVDGLSLPEGGGHHPWPPPPRRWPPRPTPPGRGRR
jgi:hypothetical protein